MKEFNKDMNNNYGENFIKVPEKEISGRNMSNTNHELIIETKHYNRVTISENQVLSFPNGLLAFEKFTNYVILPEDKNLLFHWLQSVDDPKLAFLLMDPYTINPEYVPDVFAYEIENLFGSVDLTHLKIWCIVTIPPNHPESMTINMQGPLIISHQKRLGGQFISNNESHLVRTPVLEPVETGVMT